MSKEANEVILEVKGLKKQLVKYRSKFTFMLKIRFLAVNARFEHFFTQKNSQVGTFVVQFNHQI